MPLARYVVRRADLPKLNFVGEQTKLEGLEAERELKETQFKLMEAHLCVKNKKQKAKLDLIIHNVSNTQRVYTSGSSSDSID